MKPRKPRDLPPFLQHWRKKLREAGHHLMAKRVVRRACDGCSACCTTKGIPSLGKRPWKPCHAIAEGGGCRIYGTRPNECRSYYCTWRLGFGEEDARPDRSGVVIDLDTNPEILARGLAHEGDSAQWTVALRADTPFSYLAAGSVVNDLARAGFRYFGCVDSTSGEGEPYLLSMRPKTIERMVKAFAQTGRAPWNTNPGLLDLDEHDMRSLEASRRFREEGRA